MFQRITFAVLLTLMACALSGCFFTGVENTGNISDKEIQRAMTDLERRQPTSSIKLSHADSVPVWRSGKRFYVTDDQLRYILTPANVNVIDTASLEGRELAFTHYDTQGDGLDLRNTVNLHFTLDGVEYIYRTSKMLGDFTAAYSVPLLIDIDMVDDMAAQLVGREMYVKTPIWYNVDNGTMFKGRQYILVHIDSVKPGNKVLPLCVEFTARDNGQKAMVWMSSPLAVMHNRDFDSLFSLIDLHTLYPHIDATTWNRIINSEVAENMTKEACRLALGMPKQVNQVPDPSGMREYWYYDDGRFLQFVDGLLKSYRK